MIIGNLIVSIFLNFKSTFAKYIYTRALRELEINGVPTIVVLAASNTLTKIPEKTGVIRVKEYHQSLIIQTDGNVGTKGMTLKPKVKYVITNSVLTKSVTYFTQGSYVFPCVEVIKVRFFQTVSSTLLNPAAYQLL